MIDAVLDPKADPHPEKVRQAGCHAHGEGHAVKEAQLRVRMTWTSRRSDRAASGSRRSRACSASGRAYTTPRTGLRCRAATRRPPSRPIGSARYRSSRGGTARPVEQRDTGECQRGAANDHRKHARRHAGQQQRTPGHSDGHPGQDGQNAPNGLPASAAARGHAKLLTNDASETSSTACLASQTVEINGIATSGNPNQIAL